MKTISKAIGRLLLLFAVIAVCSNVVLAISTSEYQKNLKQAITALDTLTQSDEDETEEQFNNRFADTVTAVKRSLPESVMVECGEELCTVDNSWLHDDLKALEASDEDWPLLLRHIIEKLRAIEDRVAELQGQTPGSTATTPDKQKLAEILSRPEYQKTNRANSALARLLDAILRWISKAVGKNVPVETRRTAPLNQIAEILVVALALGVLAYVAKLLLPRVLRPRNKKRKPKPEPRIVLGERLEPDQSAVDLLSEAEALARSGQVRAAIRKAYIALLVELGDRKVLSLAQHKTNRDYLRSLQAFPPIHSLMIGLTDSFERHWYGYVNATSVDWQKFRDGYRATVQIKD